MLMPADIKQRRSLRGGLTHYRKFLPNMTRRIFPTTVLLKNGATFDFNSATYNTVRSLLAEIATPPIPVFPGWYVLSLSLDPSAYITILAPLV